MAALRPRPRRALVSVDLLPAAPDALGLRMPPEWAPQRATWIAWPHNEADWPGKFEPIPWVFGEIVRHLSRRQRVSVLVEDAALERRAARTLERVGADRRRVTFVRQRTDRVWTRDSGAIFVRDARGRRAAVDFGFDAWAKYPDHERDARVATRMAAHVGVPVYRPRRPDGSRFVLEGGAIDVDGEGTLLATEECLLSRVQGRNPGLGAREQEAVLREALGIRKVVWLGRGIHGDDTHGHVDDLARFTRPGRVVCCQKDDPRDPDHDRLQDNLARLRAAKDARGRRLAVVALPMPGPLTFDGRRLPASYANFTIANGLLLVPTFNDPNDRVALGILAREFPDRQVVGIHAVDLVWGLGTLHCMTQQEPAGTGR